LAQEGLRATDFHSNGAVCSPTRAALMTGRYQQRTGIEGVVTAAGHRHTGLDLDEITMPEVMKSAGYRTAMYGKWHLGYDPKLNPVHQGFDDFKGFVSGNVDLFSHIDQTGRFDWWVQAELKDEPGYVTELITDHGVKFIAESAKAKKPFFLYLGHPAPHYPYQGPTDKGYRTVGSPKPILGRVPDFDRAYRDMMESLDKEVGRIVDALAENGVRENTLVIFIADNGAVPENKGVGASMGGLRGSKGTLWEGGHRVPGIFNWPGTIKPGESNAVMLTMDLMPTFGKLAGAKFDAGRLDGIDLSEHLRAGQALPARKTYWATRKQSVVRDGKWKLLVEKKSKQLFDLSTDLSEKKDLAASNPELVDRLSKSLSTWGAEVRAGVKSKTK
jgi:arylsulfatase A-like enzyme